MGRLVSEQNKQKKKKNASALTQTQVPKEKKQKGVKTQRGGEKFPEGGKGTPTGGRWKEGEPSQSTRNDQLSGGGVETVENLKNFFQIPPSLSGLPPCIRDNKEK